MRFFGRAFGILLILMILFVTPVAFWAFNLDRVTMNPQTYKTALKSQHFYDNLLPALVDGAASNNSADNTIRAASQALIANMSPDDWTLLSEKLLPATWLQQELTGNIDRFFDWLNGSGTTPDISFNLTTLKTRLNSTDAASAAQIIIPKLQACTASQEQALSANVPISDVSTMPLCNPESAANRKTAVDDLTQIFKLLGQKLPDYWKLGDQIRTFTAGTPHQGLNEYDLIRFRASLWLGNQFVILLFLIPVALFALIIIVTIRSSKEFFRWLGWVLILSGLITLVPVPFLSPAMFGFFPAMQSNIQRGAGASGNILASLVGGMVSSIFSGLTLAVLIQVGIAIVIGFVCVFISVLLHAPEPEVTHQEMMVEHLRLAAEHSGSTPAWLASAPAYMAPPPQSLMPTPPPHVVGSTPPRLPVRPPEDLPTYVPTTPPVTLNQPRPPDPVADLFDPPKQPPA